MPSVASHDTLFVGGEWLGREFGPEGLDPFVEIKAIGLPADVAQSLAASGL
jgi:hypothetical protein